MTDPDDIEVDYRVDDLQYDGRALRRPLGAGELTQRIYAVLYDHPEGLTVDQLHAELLRRKPWGNTDTYRAYAKAQATKQRVNRRRRRRNETPEDPSAGISFRRPGAPALEYGTERFKRQAQRWEIQHRLGTMGRHGTARREGSGEATRWYKGDRAPLVPRTGPAPRGSYSKTVPMDVEAERAAEARATEAHVRRERMKARLLADLNDPQRWKATRANLAHLRATMQATYDDLAGRWQP